MTASRTAGMGDVYEAEDRKLGRRVALKFLPVTTFTSGHLFNFAYSPDGKRLVLARDTRTGDVYLIRNFR